MKAKRFFLGASALFLVTALTMIGKADPKALAQADSDWTPLFNGKDLSGWTEVGRADWKVEDGLLIGRQGRRGAPGDLLTEASFDNFEVLVSYKVAWPANSGVWFRYVSPEQAYQADILEYKNPVAYSGTLYCPGKMFLDVNGDPELENKEGWNTLRIRAQEERLKIVLNGRVVADVEDDTAAKGQIGFQVHTGDQFENMQITVQEILIRPLAP